ncbi:MAG: hypothetical protein AAF416_13380 [Pseudomonadota bacterium]
MRLPAPNCGKYRLERTVAEIAQRSEAFFLPRLTLSVIGGQLVLSPTTPCPRFRLLVETLTARLSRCCGAHAAVARVQPEPPAIPMFALSTRLDEAKANALRDRLSRSFEKYLASPPRFESLAVVAQSIHGGPVSIVEEYSLQSSLGTPAPDSLAAIGPELLTDLGDDDDSQHGNAEVVS